MPFAIKQTNKQSNRRHDIPPTCHIETDSSRPITPKKSRLQIFKIVFGRVYPHVYRPFPFFSFLFVVL